MRNECEYLHWGLAILAALACHALAWQWLDGTAAPADGKIRAPRAPRMTFIPRLGADMPASNNGDLMTPVLFSLPSSFGFSKPMAEQSAKIIEEIGSGADEIALLERPLQKRGGDLLRWPRHMDGQVAALLADPKLNRPREILEPGLSTAVIRPVHLRLEGEIAALEFARRDLDAANLPVAEDPWLLRLKADFDPAGIPRHIFILESSAPAQVEQALLLQLKRWRLPPARGSRSGEIMLERN